MRARLSLAVLMLAAMSAPALSNPGPTTLDPALLASIDKEFADWRLARHAPGLAYGIVADGKLVAYGGHGVQDVGTKAGVSADSRFRIASMSKAFTALSILKLRDEGRLSLDVPAERYVPEMKGWRYPSSDSPRITVRHLLNHTAGFVEDNPWGDRQQVLSETEFTAMLKAGVPFSRGPGLQMEYSNLGYSILGRIIGNVSGMSYQAYIKRNMLAPLGMTATGFDVLASPSGSRAIGYSWIDNKWVREADMRDGAFGAMGGLQTNAADYAKWIAFLLSAWPERDGPETGPVRRSTVREIVSGSNFASAINRNPAIGGACRMANSYGMGWYVQEDCDLGRVVTHGGGYPGYGSIVMLLPDKAIGLFAFANLTYAAPALPATRAAMAMNKAGVLKTAMVPVSAGLASAYASAKAVWQSGDIGAAPLANNMLMDRDATRWKASIAALKAEVGECAMEEAVSPLSAMEGRFTWNCAHGRVSGRVQRAPTPAVTIQHLSFAPAAL